jgi:hypothetical protein
MNNHTLFPEGPFNKSQTILILCPISWSGKLTIPNSVTSIGNAALAFCTKLTGVTIPSSVMSIGSDAFWECNVKEVFFIGNAPVFGSSAFDYCPTTIYYMPGTRGWESLYVGRPLVLWNPTIYPCGSDFGVKTNGFAFNIVGTKDIPIVVQTCTNLANSIWVPLLTNTLAGGSLYFADPSWTNSPNRYYRIVAP